jgi:carboxypeptidase PM20D1
VLTGFSIRHGLLVLVGGCLVLVVALVANTLRQTCPQPEVNAPPAFAVDKAAAAERLAEAVRFPTVSPEDPRDFDPQPFRALHRHLERSFPRVHRALEREVVNELSLLYTWQGVDPTRTPVLLMGHLDVVPVEAAAQARWTQPPFSGRIVDGHVWGRGTLDDKGAVLGLLEATELLLARGFRPARTVLTHYPEETALDQPGKIW